MGAGLTAFDGFVLGASIGLGFQILEDIQYALTSSAARFGANPVGNAMLTIVMRITVVVAAHILYSAVFCAAGSTSSVDPPNHADAAEASH
ncbi:PrsW family intramembrane metalloprotease [Rhodococcus hoagii]|nr:PrsW family intramembrane metalloprotease [Prescottella equi]